MSLTDTLKNALSALIEGGLNRYRLDIPSSGASLDVETFSGKEFMSDLHHYSVVFTSIDQTISSSQLLNKPATLALLKLRNFRLPDSIFSTAKVAVTDPVASTNSDAAEVNL